MKKCLNVCLTILLSGHFTILLSGYLTILPSCGGPELGGWQSLSARQPRVIEIDPPSDSVIAGEGGQVSVLFSDAVDVTTVNKYSFLVAEGIVDDPFEEIKDKIDDGVLKGLDGGYLPSGDGMALEFVPDDVLKSGTDYSIILTDKVLTADKLPLAPFISHFSVEENTFIIQQDGGDILQNTLSDASGEDDNDVLVFINEVFYDAIGSDTNGVLFIELAGDATASIGGYKIALINGDDGKVSASLKLSDDAEIGGDGLYVIADTKDGSTTESNVADADFVANFDPQNGPDAVQLIDPGGKLIDAVCYGEVPVTTAENGLEMCLNTAPDAASGQSISRLNESSEFMINITPSPASYEVQEEVTQ